MMSAGKLLYRILTDCDRDVQIRTQRFKDIKASLHRVLQCLSCLQKWPLKVLTFKKKIKNAHTFVVFSLTMLWWQVPVSFSARCSCRHSHQAQCDLPCTYRRMVFWVVYACGGSGLGMLCELSCKALPQVKSLSAMSLWLLGFCHVLSVTHHGLWIQFLCYGLRFFVVDVMLRFFGTSSCLYLWFKDILVTQSQVVYKS